MTNEELDHLERVTRSRPLDYETTLALITAARRPTDHIVGVNDMVGRPDGWQPIGPEQRDGKPILAGSVNHECREVVEWQDYGEDGNEGWVNVGLNKDRFYANPRWFTHWMPLPAAPGRPSDSNLQILQIAPDQPTEPSQIASRAGGGE